MNKYKPRSVTGFGWTWNNEIREAETKLTSDSQPALCWLSRVRDAALVKSFVRFSNMLDDLLSCEAGSNEESIFIEICYVGRGDPFTSAAQSHGSSLRDRDSWTLQDHRTSCKRININYETSLLIIFSNKRPQQIFSINMLPVTVMLTALLLSPPASHQYSPLSVW